jgi:hypothetical protein
VVRATGGRGAGWLGSTAGLTGDGQFVALARFESEEAARRSSVRPEQDQWWMETSKLFAGEVIFRDSSDVIVNVNGDPGTAGFVQVMQAAAATRTERGNSWRKTPTSGPRSALMSSAA